MGIRDVFLSCILRQLIVKTFRFLILKESKPKNKRCD